MTKKKDDVLGGKIRMVMEEQNANKEDDYFDEDDSDSRCHTCGEFLEHCECICTGCNCSVMFCICDNLEYIKADELRDRKLDDETEDT